MPIFVRPHRPTVNIRGANGAQGSIALPAVFSAPVRTDVVQEIYSEYLLSNANTTYKGIILDSGRHRLQGVEAGLQMENKPGRPQH